MSSRSSLELEILKTSTLEDMVLVSQTLQACREVGVGCSLDDFGTGYSSLAYLRVLPADIGLGYPCLGTGVAA